MNHRIYIFLILIILELLSAKINTKHLECGEPPTYKYKELAKLIGNT
jgi:hypothetical protein